MNRQREYRKMELDKLVKDGYNNAHLETDYFKMNIKIYDHQANSTKTLAITNKEFNQIKEILLKKST